VATIPLLLGNKNVAMQSQTGSGKTLAYLLPIMARIFADSQLPPEERFQDVHCLVVRPRTKPLCRSTHAVTAAVLSLKVLACIPA